MSCARAAAAALFLMLLLTPLHAKSVAPTIYEQKDMGDDTVLTDFTYSISVDCTAAAIDLTVMDNHNKPVAGASTYLKYVDFSTPLIAQGQTDSSGFILEKLPGSTQIMRGLFILVLEKSGFRDKEIHFDISGCYSNATMPPVAKPPANKTASNYSQTNGTAGRQSDNSSAPPANASGVAADGSSTGAFLVPGIPINDAILAVQVIVLLGIAAVIIMILNVFRGLYAGKRWRGGKT